MDHHAARPRRALVGVAAATVGAIALLLTAFSTAASATGDHGHPCPNDGWYWHWGPQDQGEIEGPHTQDDDFLESGTGDITFTISNIRDHGSGKAFDFTSSVPVVLVRVRGYQDAGHTNDFEPAVTSGIATGGDDWIKHVYVCPADTPPPTQPSSSSSSTTASTTTTTKATTSTTEATTSTSEAPTSSAPSTTQGPTTTISSGGGLPVTGSNTTGVLVALGAGLLLAGGALVGARRFWHGAA